MNTLARYPLSDLKAVYTTLHAALRDAPYLMDNALLGELQAYLIKAARDAGIDVSDHGEWASWLARLDA